MYRNSGAYKRIRNEKDQITEERLAAISDPTYEGFVALWAWNHEDDDILIDRVPARSGSKVPITYPAHTQFVPAVRR